MLTGQLIDWACLDQSLITIKKHSILCDHDWWNIRPITVVSHAHCAVVETCSQDGSCVVNVSYHTVLWNRLRAVMTDASYKLSNRYLLLAEVNYWYALMTISLVTCE